MQQAIQVNVAPWPMATLDLHGEAPGAYAEAVRFMREFCAKSGDTQEGRKVTDQAEAVTDQGDTLARAGSLTAAVTLSPGDTQYGVTVTVEAGDSDTSPEGSASPSPCAAPSWSQLAILDIARRVLLEAVDEAQHGRAVHVERLRFAVETVLGELDTSRARAFGAEAA